MTCEQLVRFPEAVFRWDGGSPGQDRLNLGEEIGQVRIVGAVLQHGQDCLVAKEYPRSGRAQPGGRVYQVGQGPNQFWAFVWMLEIQLGPPVLPRWWRRLIPRSGWKPGVAFLVRIPKHKNVVLKTLTLKFYEAKFPQCRQPRGR